MARDFVGMDPEALLKMAEEPADVPDEDVDITDARPSLSSFCLLVPRTGVNFLGVLMFESRATTELTPIHTHMAPVAEGSGAKEY